MSLTQNNFPNYGATTSDNGQRPRSSSDVSLYNQLCDNIQCNIFSINNNVGAFESSCKDIGTKVDSEKLRDKIHGYQQSANELIGSTTRFVKELQRIVQQRGISKEQRFQAKRLENEFQETVKRYSMLQTQLVPKMKQTLLMSKEDKKPTTGEPDVWGCSEEDAAAEQEKQMQAQQMQDDLKLELGLLLERDQRIRQIEADILDVNATFKELGLVVHEQGDMLGTIEENITATAYQVEAGTQQLAKASGYQKKYRKKLCWLVLILLIVATIIAIVIYISSQ